MHAVRFPASLLAAAVVACAPAEPPADPAADEAALTALAERELAAFTSGDLDALDDFFAADAVVMPPNEPTITGIEDLRAWAAGLHEQFMVSGSYSSVENHVDGDLAYQTMALDLSITPKAGGDAMTDRGRGVHVLRRQPDGSWKIVLDVWNSTMPAPGM